MDDHRRRFLAGLAGAGTLTALGNPRTVLAQAPAKPEPAPPGPTVALDVLRAGQQPQPEAQRAVVVGADAGFEVYRKVHCLKPQ